MKDWILKKRWRIILSGILIVAVPLLSLAAFVNFEVNTLLEKKIIYENQLVAQLIAHRVEERLRSDVVFGKAYAARPHLLKGLMRGNKKEMDIHLENLIDNSFTIERAFITTPEGVQLANYPYTANILL